MYSNRSGRSLWILALLGILLVLALATSSYLLGFLAGSSGYSPRDVWARVYARLSDAAPPPVAFHSIFVKLNADRVKIPVIRDGYGGGLTSIAGNPVILTHEGRIFSIDSQSRAQLMPVQTPDNGYQGLSRVALSPKYKGYWFDLHYHRYNDILFVEDDTRAELYISYTEFFEKDACYTATVAKLVIEGTGHHPDKIRAQEGDWKIVFRTNPCLPLKGIQRAIEGHIAGGRMEISPSKEEVFLTVGDYTWDGVWGPKAVARSPDFDYGKIIAINRRTSDTRVVSQGHRNHQGISFDLQGRLWTVENGPRGGDELNLIREGADYGWPDETLGTLYNALPWPSAMSYGRHDHFTPPVYAWLPSVAPSSLTVINGFHETWHGDLLMTTMHAQSLYRLRIVGDSVQFAEHIFVGQRLRDVIQLDSSKIALWTDRHELMLLTVGQVGTEWAMVEKAISESDLSEDQIVRLQREFNNCLRCHEITYGVHRNAPGLSTIYGSRIASTSYNGYSDSLKRMQGSWDAESLHAFIRSPSDFAPGTSMPDTGIEDDWILNALIGVLHSLRYPQE